mgnify:CR=1 FL=1
MNLCWIIFTLLGGVIFGVIPATLTLAEVFRKTIVSSDEFNWFRHAWRTYFVYMKKYFVVSLLFVGINLCLILSYYTLGFKYVIFKSVIVITAFYVNCAVLPYLTINEVHFQLPIKVLLKNSALLPVFWTTTTLKIIAVSVAVILLSYLIPGGIPFFSFAIPIYLNTFFILTRWQNYLKTEGREI